MSGSTVASASGDEAGLRARLVQVGVDLVASEGLSALTLREIARRTGVSHGAPRRYFPTHLDLLSAIAREGYAELASRITASLADGQAATDGQSATDGQAPTDGSADPRAQLTSLAREYVEFGRANRGMFELMFRHDLLESNRLRLREVSLPLFESLLDLVTRARPDIGSQARVVAGSLWAGVHGIAQLSAWGSLALAVGSDDVEPLLRATFDAHLGR